MNADVVARRFQIEGRAGAGAMGTVFRALDLTTGERVAIKVLHASFPGAAERFVREAAALERLSHPRIVRHVGHGTTEKGDPYIAMEWLEGEDLASRLRRAPLSVDETLRVARGAAEALAHAHARGVVHRDIKPANLFCSGGELDRLKIVDLGLVRVADEASLTGDDTMLGTPGYMPPEQVRGEVIDARADVFALGCVLFKCLTRKGPFAAPDATAVLAKILFEQAPRLSDLLPDVPPALDALLARMLAKERDGRPADGAALLAELDRLDVVPMQASLPRDATAKLGTDEKRIVSIVVASDELAHDQEATLLREHGLAPHARALREAAMALGAHFELLPDGSAVASISGEGSAMDHAARAARCALAIRAILPAIPIALETGRAEVGGRHIVGEVIERATSLLRSTASGAPAGRSAPIRLGEVCAGLLDIRFDVSGDDVGLVLRGERGIAEATRMLLGRETPCVGRDAELAMLVSVYDGCVADGEARAVLVTGPAGVGKSRVRYELVRALRARPGPKEIWLARADPMSAGSPFGMLAPAIRRAAGILDGEAPSIRRRKLEARVARHVPASAVARVSEFLGEMIGVPFPDESNVRLRAARRDAGLMGDQMRQAWVDFVAGELAEQPLVVVLEDLHWGDLPSVSCIDEALRRAADRPLMVLALGRPETRTVFPKLWAQRGVHEMVLGELKRKGSEKLVRAVLGAAVGDDVVSRVVERAAGNPFYLEELIRAVAAGKGDELPETVVAMVHARLETLGAPTRRVLRAASVYGQVFWRGAVAALLGPEDAADTGGLLAELVDREVIAWRGEGRFPGEGEYVFRHAIVRDTAYAMLTDADRALGHRLAGQWLERAGETEAVVLAEHYERGGDLDAASGLFRRAATEALEASDLAASLRCAERAERCGAEGERLGEIRLIQAEAHRWQGNTVDARSHALEAMRLLPRGGAAWCAAAGEVAVSSGGAPETLEEVAAEVRALLASGEASGALLSAWARVHVPLLMMGRHDLVELGDVRTRVARAAEYEPMVQCRLWNLYATCALVDGDPSAYATGMERSAAALEAAGDLRTLCAARIAIGFGYTEIGAYAEAEQALRRSLEDARRLGLHSVASSAGQNLGLALARQGSLDEATRLEQESVADARAQRNPRKESVSLGYLAIIRTLANDVAGAERAARAALACDPVAPPLRAYLLAILADALLRAQRTSEALPATLEAMEILESQGRIHEGESLVRLTYAEALDAVGDRAGAARAIADARDRLLARAAKIADPARRRSFLENVAEHARTVRKAAAIEGT